MSKMTQQEEIERNKVISRTLSFMRSTFKPIEISNYCDLIDEIVEKSEWAIQKSTECYPDGSSELAATIHIRQMLDYGDAISLLIKQGSGDSTLPLIRVLFELSMSLKYLLANDFENRAKKFLFYYYKKKEVDLLKGKPGTDEHKNFRARLVKDKYLSESTIEEFFIDNKIDEKIHYVQELLNSETYKELNIYYDKKATKGEKKYWYSICHGPRTFEKLVQELGMNSRYEISYRFWSGYTHGWDIVNKNLVFENEGAKIVAKRNPLNSDINTRETITILRGSLMNYVAKRLQNEAASFAKWLYEYTKKFEAILVHK